MPLPLSRLLAAWGHPARDPHTWGKESPQYLELEQAVIRVVIGALILAYVLFHVWRDGLLGVEETRTLVFTVGFFVFAVALAARIYLRGDISVPRRVGAIVADNAANTFFMLLAGEYGSTVVGVYLFVTFGYGFRYGRMYLHISQAFAAIGFCVVLWLSPFWAQHHAVGFGLLLAIAVLPFYVGVLAGRLVEARKRAEDASRAKGRFLANMSHEMRTPLNGVLAMADLLRETHLSDGQREIVNTMTTSGQLLLAQVEDVLDEAKIEAGRIQIEQRPFDLGKLLSATIKVLLPQARYKGLAVRADIDPGAARWFLGDGHHLRQALLNLLSNAVKFTERGEVTLQVTVAQSNAGGARLHFEVRDTGIGIAPEKQAVIFEPFTQADDSIGRVYGGTGLGTTIARQLVGLMGGQIHLSSKLGAGSCFSFELELPFADPDSAESEADVGSGVRAATTAFAPPNVSIIRGARILVAEDNPTNQRVTRMILESGGHEVTVVENGEEALDALERGRYDIALFDLSMPGVTGLEALKLYRFSVTTPIPVLILSATVTGEIIAQCEHAGAAEFLSKPVRASALLSSISRHLAPAARGRLPQGTTVSRPDERVMLTVVGQAVIDQQAIAELSRISPDPTFIHRIIQAFGTDCTRLVAEICDAFAKQRYETVKDAVHALKGAAGGMGAVQLVHYATRLEKATYENMRARELSWTEELRRLAAEAITTLEGYLEDRRNQRPEA